MPISIQVWNCARAGCANTRKAPRLRMLSDLSGGLPTPISRSSKRKGRPAIIAVQRTLVSETDRKRVVEGKSGSARVEREGRRANKTKKITNRAGGVIKNC